MDSNLSSRFDYMTYKMGALGIPVSDKVKNSKGGISNAIKDLIDEDKMGDANDAATAVVESIIGNINSFASDDPFLIAAACFDLVGSLTQFAALAGPHGQVFAAVVGPICKLFSGIFGLFGGKSNKETPEEMLERIVTECLAVDTNEELQREADGNMAEMQTQITFLMGLTQKEELDEHVKAQIIDNWYLTAGEKFITIVNTYCDQNKFKDTHEDGERTAKMLYYMAHISMLRFLLLSLWSTLCYQIGANDTADGAIGEINAHRTWCQKKLEHWSWPLGDKFDTNSKIQNTQKTYYSLHFDLNALERGIFDAHRRYIGCSEWQGLYIILRHSYSGPYGELLFMSDIKYGRDQYIVYTTHNADNAPIDSPQREHYWRMFKYSNYVGLYNVKMQRWLHVDINVRDINQGFPMCFGRINDLNITDDAKFRYDVVDQYTKAFYSTVGAYLFAYPEKWNGAFDDKRHVGAIPSAHSSANLYKKFLVTDSTNAFAKIYARDPDSQSKTITKSNNKISKLLPAKL